MRDRVREELRERLQDNRFTHFVTLASNAPGTSIYRMDDWLKAWDASMNHILIGSRWRKRPDLRMIWFAFLEKPETNPHWHLLVDNAGLETEVQLARLENFGLEADRMWGKVSPRGSVNTQLYLNSGAIDYVTKSVRGDVSMMRSSLDFIRNN